MVSKDEWGTKEGTGKFMKNMLYEQQYPKRHLSGWSNVEQWKNQAHVPCIAELCLSEDLSQSKFH